MNHALTAQSAPDQVRVVLFEGETVAVGRWRCPVGNPLFRNSGPAHRYLFCFPRTSVWIQHEGAAPFVAMTAKSLLGGWRGGRA